MKKIMTITIVIVACCMARAQQNCIPSYTMAVKRIAINDSVQIAYLEKGKGKTLVFIHGLGGNLSHWQQNMDALSNQFRCIAIDLPGYGCSTTPINTTDQLATYADLIIAMLQKLQLTDVTLVGHSMGGQIAVIAALKSSQIITKLVLVAPAGFEQFSATEKELLSNISTQPFFKTQDEQAIRASFKNNFYQLPAAAEPLIAYRIAQRDCANFSSYCNTIVQGINGMLRHPVKSQLSLLQQPVLVVFGAADNLIPNKYLHPSLTTLGVATEGANEIKNHHLVILPKAGHLLQVEQPEAFKTALLQFLKK